MFGLVVVVVLVLLVASLLPRWPYSTSWGYYPSGGAGFVLLIVILLLLFGRGL